ncbi:cation:proton antiporter domain-containing protein [Halomarina oriensis]|uniref:Potassium transporter n=1 Tax=Halomarina oriensis TaxID=671145 RepID=A0A6B0GLF1_9EURY|nr:potassium transporter [Halomarina oriensis]
MASELIPLVAGIIALGVVSQILGDRFRTPSIIFLIAAGLLLGPVSGFFLPEPIVSQATFGESLSAIVGLSVAIIVFEGAFHLKIDKLREAPAETIRLVTVGAVIALVGTAIVVKLALPAEWDVAFLIGALLVATGPTVIAPILEVVPARDRVEAALETEGIVNDVTAAIIAVVVFEVVIGHTGESGLVAGFVERLGIGMLVGVVVAGGLYYAIRYVDLSPQSAPQNARLLVLAGALVSYGAADYFATEAGLPAVATAGILLGNADLPYEEDITDFKGDITLIVLSFVFIALAALLQPQEVIDLGIGGIIVVVVVAVVIRPLLVFVSLFGDRFTTGEKLFMSFVGPRGIIPASVATLFAVELRAEAAGIRAGDIAGTAAEAAALDSAATLLVGTVFLVIMATVVFEAGLARYIAEYLDIIPMRAIIIGGGTVGRALADRLEDRGENVVIVEETVEILELARNEGHTVMQGDGTDIDVLQSAGAGKASTLVAATGDDDVNLLVSQLADSRFDIETIVSRVNNANNVDAFEDLGVRTVAPTTATAQAIDNLIERPALAKWTSGIGENGDVQEVEVTSEDLVGRSVREVGPELPGGCLITLVARDGEVQVPNADFVLDRGDRITIIGDRESVREAMVFCHPE